MEYCHCGSVASYVRKGNRLNEEELREIASCCLLGLNYLHKKNIIHRVSILTRIDGKDIKPDNLLISESGVIKVGDFGLAVQLEHACSNRNTVCGTSWYMGPEVYAGQCVLKSDVWSLGMSMIEIAEGRHPFAGMNSFQVAVIDLVDA